MHMKKLNLKPKAILLADDDEMMLFVLAEFLEARGYRVDTATTPLQAALALRKKKYDFVISDLNFTTENHLEGLGLIGELGDSDGPQKVFVLSGDRTWEVARDHRMKKIAAYIPKPIGLEALATIIENSGSPILQ